MLAEILGGLAPTIGRMIGGSQSSSTMPSMDPQEFLDAYKENVYPIFDEEEDFVKSQTKKSKKKSDKILKPSRAEEERLRKEIAKNYDMLTNSYMDAAMTGAISGEEALGKFEELEALGLFNPGSVINERGDTSFSKKAAAEKKILEEIIPRQQEGSRTALAHTIMGRNLREDEKRYYNDRSLFKNPEDVAAAMRLTEEGGSRFIGDPEIERMIMMYGGKMVNPTAKNINNMPYYMRKGISNPAEAAAVSQARTA